MGTTLHRMTGQRYASFLEEAVADYAEQNVSAGRWSVEGALERSRQEHARLLPQGIATPDQHLFTIHDDIDGVEVGVLWIAVNERPGGRFGYVYDLAIEAAHRRQGHARAALIALEEVARELGVVDVGLHVFANNSGALALYRALGFETTGINMQKRIA